MNRESLLARIEALQPTLERHGVNKLFLFGSFARGEARRDSDVDLMVEFSRPVGLLEFAGLKLELEEALGCRVDLVTRPAIRDEFSKQIELEAIRAA